MLSLQNLIFDAPKLMYLAYTLVSYLRKGVPLAVTMFYAAMLALTWVISFYRFQRSTIDRYLVIKRLFYLCVGHLVDSFVPTQY